MLTRSGSGLERLALCVSQFLSVGMSAPGPPWGLHKRPCLGDSKPISSEEQTAESSHLTQEGPGRATTF